MKHTAFIELEEQGATRRMTAEEQAEWLAMFGSVRHTWTDYTRTRHIMDEDDVEGFLAESLSRTTGLSELSCAANCTACAEGETSPW